MVVIEIGTVNATGIVNVIEATVDQGVTVRAGAGVGAVALDRHTSGPPASVSNASEARARAPLNKF